MKAPPSIGFEYRASPSLIVAALVVALLALVAVWISAAPPWLRLVLILFIAIYSGVGAGTLLRPRVRSVLWRADGGAELTLGDRATDGRREAEGAIHAVRVMGPLIVLTLRWPPRERATLWLLPDNLDADTRRRLRVRLGAETAATLTSGNADSG